MESRKHKKNGADLKSQMSREIISNHMENTFFAFIKPYLSVIDNGNFFRKPFSWLYIFFAVLSLIAPIYLIYNAFALNSAYDSRDKCREKFEIVSQQFDGIKQKYNSAVQIANQSRSAAQNAYQNYTQASRNMQYYGNYIQNFRQDYENAQKQSKQWLAAYNEAVNKSNLASQESANLKPEYDKISLEFNQTNQEYLATIEKYNSQAPKGAFHTPNIKVRAILALLLFSLLTIFIGLVNFQIFWDRKSKMNLTSKENDEFTAFPAVAHYIQTFGESIGTYIGIMGTFTILIAMLFKVCFGTYGLGKLFIIDIENLSNNLLTGIPYILLPIIAGFMTIVLFRVIGEGIKAIVVIANNTRKL